MAKKTNKKRLFDTELYNLNGVEYIISDRSVIMKTGYLRISYTLGTWQYNLWAALIRTAMKGRESDNNALKVYTNALLSTAMNVLDPKFVEELSRINSFKKLREEKETDLE